MARVRGAGRRGGAARHVRRAIRWLVAGGPAALRTLLLCDGAQFWMVKAVAIGDKGEPPARTAFDLFLRTVRFEAAAATAAPSGG